MIEILVEEMPSVSIGLGSVDMNPTGKPKKKKKREIFNVSDAISCFFFFCDRSIFTRNRNTERK